MPAQMKQREGEAFVRTVKGKGTSASCLWSLQYCNCNVAISAQVMTSLRQCCRCGPGSEHGGHAVAQGASHACLAAERRRRFGHLSRPHRRHRGQRVASERALIQSPHRRCCACKGDGPKLLGLRALRLSSSGRRRPHHRAHVTDCSNVLQDVMSMVGLCATSSCHVLMIMARCRPRRALGWRPSPCPPACPRA